VDDVDKWLYNFASMAMESTDQLPVESIESEPLVVPPSEPHKKLACRKAGFTKQEDHVICSAFLNVSKDGATGRTHRYYCSHTITMTCVVGVNQSNGSYYKRFHEYYLEHMPARSERTQVAIQHR
jgi:hypothetical protein